MGRDKFDREINLRWSVLEITPAESLGVAVFGDIIHKVVEGISRKPIAL